MKKRDKFIRVIGDMDVIGASVIVPRVNGFKFEPSLSGTTDDPSANTSQIIEKRYVNEEPGLGTSKFPNSSRATFKFEDKSEYERKNIDKTKIKYARLYWGGAVYDEWKKDKGLLNVMYENIFGYTSVKFKTPDGLVHLVKAKEEDVKWDSSFTPYNPNAVTRDTYYKYCKDPNNPDDTGGCDAKYTIPLHPDKDGNAAKSTVGIRSGMYFTYQASADVTDLVKASLGKSDAGRTFAVGGIASTIKKTTPRSYKVTIDAQEQDAKVTHGTALYADGDWSISYVVSQYGGWSLVIVYDFGEEVVTRADGSTQTVPYLVMEYVQGHTVRELLSEGEAVPIDEAGEIVSGVLQALGYSHRNGIVHRDIKPGNIMLTNTGEVKVMDFGIARAIEDSAVTVTQTHAVVGTAQYLSPEQARGEVVDARSDIYSCGCLLYELLTGRPPFKGDSAVAIAYQHVRELPVPPSQIAPDVPESMDRVVMKALAKHREDRYQNADQMRADLQAAIRGLQVNAPATETWQQQATTVIAPTPGVPSAPAATNTGSIPKVKDEQAARQAEEEAAKRKKKQLLIIGLITLVALLALVGALAAAGVFGGTPSKEKE